MVIEYIRYKVAVDQSTAFQRAYANAADILDRSEHCISYELSQCTEEKEVFTVRIEWDSVEGHLNGFRKSAEFGQFFELVKPFFQQIQEMRHYEIVDAQPAR